MQSDLLRDGFVHAAKRYIETGIQVVIEVEKYGLKLRGTARDKSGKVISYNHLVSYIDLDNCNFNPLLSAIDHVTKELRNHA